MAIGIGIIGTGFGQIVHIPGFQACRGTEVVAVYHRNLEKAQQVAANFNIPYASDRLSDILSLPEVNAIAISTPPFLHYETVKAALLAHKHVLLEKPITLNVTEARELQALADRQNCIVAVDFEFRFIPQWRYFKDLLDQDLIGKPRSILINWLVPGRADPSRIWNWYSQKSLGGGALGALGSHTFDYVSWLFGEVKSLSAQLSTAIPLRPDRHGVLQAVDADDTCHILLELSDRTPCNIAISTVAYGGRGHWVTVYGDRGSLVLGSNNLKDYGHGFEIYHHQPQQEPKLLTVPSLYDLPKLYQDGRLAPFIALCDQFVAAIESKSPMVPGLKEGIYSQLLMDLTHQAHAQKRWVTVI